MAKHKLKCTPNQFEAMMDGKLTFQIRYNRDRGYQCGDTLLLKEYKANEILKEHDGTGDFYDDSMCYTNRQIRAEVTYVSDYEQRPGVVVLAINVLDVEEKYSFLEDE